MAARELSTVAAASVEVYVGQELFVPSRALLLARVASKIALGLAERFFRRLLRSPLEPGGYVEAIRSAGGRSALYIHMPFCHRPLCSFCCFVRYPFNQAMHQAYVKTLLREVEWLASNAEEAKVETLYIGGGTPSIDVYSLAEVVDRVRESFGGGIQVSAEANPRDINDETVEVLRSAGVSRLSIGAQALEPGRLRRLGRLNTTVRDAYRAARLAGGRFETVNLDMIWGVRGDTPETVRREARRALGLPVDQVTFYPLMPAPGMRRLEKMRMEGPWHPLEPRLYEAILGEALAHGFRPATPWCMDRGSRLIDEYVVEYTQFLALGVSGIGNVNGYTYVNTFNLKKYIELVSSRGFSAALAVKTSGTEDMLYRSLTTAFGGRWPPEGIALRYGLKGRLLALLGSAALRVLGEKRDGRGYRIQGIGALYLLHSIQRSVYMAVNMLREEGVKRQL